jgi:type IV pilus assembly protein PilB
MLPLKETHGKPKSGNKLLGSLLLKNKLINQSQLDEAIKIQARTKKLVGSILIEQGHLTEEDIAYTFAQDFDMEYINPQITDIQREATKYISSALAKRYNTIPIKAENGILHIASDKPLSTQIKGNLTRLTGKHLKLYVSTTSKIRTLLDNIYNSKGEHKVSIEGTSSEKTDDTMIIKLVDRIIEKAIRDRATDIHFETFKDRLRIRFRVDGLLREIEPHPIDIAPSVITRIKVLARMNIAEKRSPQDGGFTFVHNPQPVDIRVSTLPNIYGEKAVLRLLNTGNVGTGFDSLGMEQDSVEIFESLIKRPYGIILLASPTGSGKSTTLNSVLLKLRSEQTNIITVEDPVEYKVDGITQVQVDSAMKVTFPSALRAILRQDPDIIMIGEIRDRETAEIALKASLTGHLVLATIHTNDAPSALPRLMDMGCEPYLISSSISGVIAQRLVRTLCPYCKTPFEPTEGEIRNLGCPSLPEGTKWCRAPGCPRCYYTGYRGRMAIFELLKINSDIQQAIVDRAPAERIKEVAIATGMRTLLEDGIIKINKGVTSPEEIIRVTLIQ